MESGAQIFTGELSRNGFEKRLYISLMICRVSAGKQDFGVELNVGMGMTERLKVVETKTMKWTLTVAFEDHSPPPSLLIMSRGGRKERT